MRKLDLILENIRDEYMINLLEEGETTELETLKTKKFLNENLNRIRGMLVEEGVMDSVKNHLGNNWGNYLTGAGALGAGAVLGDEALQNIQNPEFADQAQQAGQVLAGAGQEAAGQAQDAMQQFGDNFIDQAGVIYNKAGEVVGNVAQQAGAVADQAQEAIGGVVDQAQQAIGGQAPQA